MDSGIEDSDDRDDNQSDAGTPVKSRKRAGVPETDASKGSRTETSMEGLPESPTVGHSGNTSTNNDMCLPSTPKKKKSTTTTSKSPQKNQQKSPLKALEESFQNAPKKGLNTKNKKGPAKRQNGNQEELRQTAALEDMVRVVKGAGRAPRSPKSQMTSRERWLSVTGDRMERMDTQVLKHFKIRHLL